MLGNFHKTCTYAMDFDFCQEIHRTRTFFRNNSKQVAYRHSLPPSTKQSFPNVLVAYLFKSGTSEVREIIFKSYRIVCRLGKVEF